MSNATANMLRTLLACAERPDDKRLNSHLSESDIAETIRVTIECLDAETAKADESAKLRAALETVAKRVTATDGGFMAIPPDAWETVLTALGKK